MEKFGKWGWGDTIVLILILLGFAIPLQIVFSMPDPVTLERPVEDERWSEHEWLHFSECQQIADHYGVFLKMWSWPNKTIHVHIPQGHLFSTGTDGACQWFGEMCVKFLDIYNDGWLLTVTSDDDFIPSAKRNWAKLHSFNDVWPI